MGHHIEYKRNLKNTPLKSNRFVYVCVEHSPAGSPDGEDEARMVKQRGPSPLSVATV